jgi:lysophospholipase L1-like esterase
MRCRTPAVVLLGTLVLAAALEGGARLLPIGLPDLADQHLAWALGDQRVFTARGEELVTAAGLQEQGNSPESFPSRKPAGTFRVICVGDSTTAGWPYNPSGAYPRWLAAILADARPDARVEVINAGFHGFDSRRSLAVLREVLRYRPDAVVFRAGYNDFHLLRARKLAPLPLAQWLTLHSQLYNLVRRARGRVPGRFSLQPTVQELSAEEEDELASAYASTVRQAAAAARAAGAALVLGDLPDGAALHPYPGRRSVARLRAELRVLAAREGLTLAEFPGLTPGRFVDHVHCDAEGYRLAALGTAKALERSGVLPGRWRWDAVRKPEVMARALGLSDPEFAAHVHVRLAGMLSAKGDEPRAVGELVLALRAAPNPRLVPEEIEGSGNGAMLEALRLAQAAR